MLAAASSPTPPLALVLKGLALALVCTGLLAVQGSDVAEAQARRVKDEMVEKVFNAKPPSHRSQRQGMFALTKIERASIVMLGDSLTERAQWSEITGCYFVANRGIGADDSAGVLRRLEEVTRLNPRAVFLMIGVNDLSSGVPVEKIAANVRQIIAHLNGADIKVYLTAVLPVTQGYRRKINSKINELNALYAKMQSDKVRFFDFTRDVSTEDGYLIENLSIDGIHLAPGGYRIWRDAILPFVTENCVMPPKPTQAVRVSQ
jgi:lysophospholipase L1-like esterase